MKQIVRAFDRFLSRLHGVFVFWDDPDCMFRAELARARHEIVLPGAVIPAGEKVLLIHFWNEQMPQISLEGPDMAMALRTSRMIVSSFRVLARLLRSDPQMAGVRALGGATVLFAAGDESGAEKLFIRLGFTMSPYKSPLGRFGEFWENFYTWALMWAYNAVSLRQRRLLALHRTEAWMTPEKFLLKYGTGTAPQAHEPHEMDAEGDS